jgi:hypothetical protein
MDRPTAQVLAGVILVVVIGVPWLVGMWTLIERVLNG